MHTRNKSFLIFNFFKLNNSREKTEELDALEELGAVTKDF